jgi:hypothetical protein
MSLGKVRSLPACYSFPLLGSSSSAAPVHEHWSQNLVSLARLARIRRGPGMLKLLTAASAAARSSPAREMAGVSL